MKTKRHQAPDFRQLKSKLNHSLNLARRCFLDKKESPSTRLLVEDTKTIKEER